MLYIGLCEIRQKKGVVVRPMVFAEMNYRSQIDLIDMQAQLDGPYKFIYVLELL